MKKVLITALVLVLAFSMFSCGGIKDIEEFKNAIGSASPIKTEVVTTFNTAHGELKSNATTTYNEDGSFTLAYWYEQFNTAMSGAADEIKTKVEATVTCDKDGKYSDGGTLAATTTATTGHVLNLKEKLISYKVSENGTVLTATVAKDNTKEVFGVEIAADVTLVVTMVDEQIISFTMNYTLENLGDVQVVCNYTYAAKPAA